MNERTEELFEELNTVIQNNHINNKEVVLRMNVFAKTEGWVSLNGTVLFHFTKNSLERRLKKHIKIYSI